MFHPILTIMFCLLWHIYSATACLRMSTGSSGGEIPVLTTAADVSTIPVSTTPASTTFLTTTTENSCPQMQNLVLFYKHDDVELTDLVYGKVEPVSMCTNCDDGTVGYYASATTDIPNNEMPESAGSYTQQTCPTFCVCDWNDECFQPNGVGADSTVITFWPYCSGGTCGMYVYVARGSLASTTTSTTITDEDQLNSAGTPKPVTDPSYFSAKSIGCDNCNPTSCPV